MTQRYCIIQAGTVSNIVKAEPAYAAAQGWVEAGNANIGDTYDAQAGTFTAPVIPPAVLAERQRLADIDSAIKGDAVMAALKAMTPAEYDTWWSANVTTAAQANAVLKRVVRIVIRRMT